MTASTLDLTDLEHLLDAEPACQGKDCDHSATRRLRWACGCLHLVCADCAAYIVARVAEVLLSATDVIWCRECNVALPGRYMSDVVRVNAL